MVSISAYYHLGDFIVRQQMEAGYIVPLTRKPLFKVFLGWYLSRLIFSHHEYLRTHNNVKINPIVACSDVPTVFDSSE